MILSFGIQGKGWLVSKNYETVYIEQTELIHGVIPHLYSKTSSFY